MKLTDKEVRYAGRTHARAEINAAMAEEVEPVGGAPWGERQDLRRGG